MTSAARLSTWLIRPSVWSPGGSISHQYSFITQRSLTWRTKHEMTNDAIRCSTQLGATWTQVSRCLCLSREPRRRSDWSTPTNVRCCNWSSYRSSSMEQISELKQKRTFGIQVLGRWSDRHKTTFITSGNIFKRLFTFCWWEIEKKHIKVIAGCIFSLNVPQIKSRNLQQSLDF